MREKGIAIREIARVLSISVREVYRLLRSVVTSVVRVVRSASKPTVQGSPALSDFKGGSGPASLSLGDVGIGEVNSVATIVNDDVVISEPATAHGGAIAAAIVSEYGVRAHCAQHGERYGGRWKGGSGGNQPRRESDRVYSASHSRDRCKAA